MHAPATPAHPPSPARESVPTGADTSVEAAVARERMQRMARLGSLGWGVFGVAYALLDRPRTALICAAATLASLVSVAILRAPESRKRTRLSIHIGLGSGTFALLAEAQVTGQGESMPLWYLTLVPFVGGLLGDRRVALGWTLVASTGVLLTHLLGAHYPVKPEFTMGPTEWLVGQLVLIGMALAAAIATRRGTDATLAKVRQREAVITAQSVELASARDSAQAASRAKSEFLANMTHELRTPLNGLIGPVEVLSATELSATQRETLEIVESSARALRNLVDSLLDFSKIEAGLMELTPERTRIRRSVHETLRIFAGMARSRQVELSATIDDDVPSRVRLDATRFQQTLLNLVGNAVKFTRDGRVDVHVSYDTTLAQLRVSVADTGVGIPHEALPHIFEAFRQVHTGSTREFGGTGLGLAICGHLVALAGGRIEVASEVGRGTRFEFTWPAPHSMDDTQSALGLDQAGPSRLRVLVVEDEPVNQKVITMMLRQLGVHAELVDNGSAAVARGADYDVVFMDMRLPGMDGLDATRAIRGSGGQRQPWVIAATANATEHDRSICLAAGMNDFVAKPLQLKHLARALERAEEGLAESAESEGRLSL